MSRNMELIKMGIINKEIPHFYW